MFWSNGRTDREPVFMSILLDIEETKDRDAASAGLHREHSLDVPAHRHQIPFAFDVFQAPQQALAITHDGFDDAEHGLRSLLAQSVQFFTAGRSQSIRHLLQRRGRFGWTPRSGGKTLLPSQIGLASKNRTSSKAD